MKLARCGSQSVANVILADKDNNMYRVAIFNQLFEEISNHGKQVIGEGELADYLLSAPTLKYTITSKDTVSSVSQI